VRKNLGTAYTLPITVWTSVFFLVPIAIILIYSFLTKGLYGGIEWIPTSEAYRALLNPVFARVAFTTLWISVVATAVTVLLAVPCAYFMARSNHKDLFLFLIIIPFWTNFLIRIYAWIAILGNNGFLNAVLVQLGITDEYIQFLYNNWAVIIVLVYTYLPYAILPLYSTIEKFDFSLLEAARDLGASHLRSLVSVMLPNIRGGIMSAVLFTFIPSFGAYAIPQLVGGKDSLMMGNIIARELTVTRNWPLASSISVVITLVTTICIMLFMRRSSSAAAAPRTADSERDGIETLHALPRGNVR
jgi:spermidine/putrescine transport system permease protein